MAFWSYLFSAFAGSSPGVGTVPYQLVRAPHPPPLENVLALYINQLSADNRPHILVLDDFHVIDSVEIHRGIAFLVDHLPANVCLVIASRSDPPLSLPRLRARGELTELRAADLRFTNEEATAFLPEAMGVDLSAADILALETRTEGWAAGLRLAALSMRGRADVSDLIQAFAGNDRYIVDYLIEEVLHRLDDDLGSFLLETSVLARLNGDLCDAVTGRSNGRETLETLERANLFVVPLDTTRQWFRYHHLFADVLRVNLTNAFPDLVAVLHQRAATWFSANGSWEAAIGHALDAKNYPLAAEIIEMALPVLARSKQNTRALQWMRALPDDVVRNRPVLSAGLGSALLGIGDLDGADHHLRNAERWIGTDSNSAPGGVGDESGPIVADTEAFRRLPAMIGVYRAAHAHIRGETGESVAYAQAALESALDHQHLLKGAAGALIGLARWAEGDIDSAFLIYRDAIESLRRADNIADVISGTMSLADMRLVQGRLRDAEVEYRRSVDLVTEYSATPLMGTADLSVGLADIHRERNELDAAAEMLTRSAELAVILGLPENRDRRQIAEARLCVAKGQLAEALGHFDEAEHFRIRGFYPVARPLPAMRVPVWIALGDLDSAIRWSTQSDVAFDDQPTFLREYELLTLIRVAIAVVDTVPIDPKLDRSLFLIDRLLARAEIDHRTGSVIEILVMKALTLQATAAETRAVAALEQAMILAEPERYARIFLDEGTNLHALLALIGPVSPVSAYATRLRTMPSERPTELPITGRVTGDGLAEQLTPREIEILRLVSDGLRNQEIADCLFIGLATVKRHIANLYGKLGVTHRTEAVARANEFHLL